MWASFASAGFNYHSLLTKTAWDFLLGSGLILQQPRDSTTPDGETVRSVASKQSVEVWRLTPTSSRAGWKWEKPAPNVFHQLANK